MVAEACEHAGIACSKFDVRRTTGNRWSIGDGRQVRAYRTQGGTQMGVTLLT